MIHLVYVSSAAYELSTEELLGLLAQSRERNSRQHITGMLLYAGGNFFQVLEGEQKDVEEIYASIVKDNRNKGNIVLLKEKIERRTFPDWSMGFKQLTSDNKSAITGYTEFLDRNISPEEFASHSHEVLAMLYQFKKGNV